MLRRLALPLAVASAVVLGACGGGDEPAAESGGEPNESASDDLDDDVGAVSPGGWVPVLLEVRLPGGARVEADPSMLVVRAEPFGEPTTEIAWDGLTEVAAALEETGVHAQDCAEPSALGVTAQDAERVAYVWGSVCDGTPEAVAVLEALAPVETALGVGLLDLENARLPDPPPPVPDDSRVEYVVIASPGSEVEAVELTVRATEAVATNERGRSTISLSHDELAQLVDDLQTVDLPVAGPACDGASSNSVTVFLGSEEALSAAYLRCSDDGGFDRLVDVMEPTLDRFGLGVRP